MPALPLPPRAIPGSPRATPGPPRTGASAGRLPLLSPARRGTVENRGHWTRARNLSHTPERCCPAPALHGHPLPLDSPSPLWAGACAVKRLFPLPPTPLSPPRPCRHPGLCCPCWAPSLLQLRRHLPRCFCGPLLSSQAWQEPSVLGIPWPPRDRAHTTCSFPHRRPHRPYAPVSLQCQWSPRPCGPADHSSPLPPAAKPLGALCLLPPLSPSAPALRRRQPSHLPVLASYLVPNPLPPTPETGQLHLVRFFALTTFVISRAGQGCGLRGPLAPSLPSWFCFHPRQVHSPRSPASGAGPELAGSVPSAPATLPGLTTNLTPSSMGASGQEPTSVTPSPSWS